MSKDKVTRLSDLAEGSTDVLKIDPKLIVVIEGFNYRNFKLKSNKDHLKDTKASIRENGIENPLWVRFDPEGVPVLIAGETRLRSVLEILNDPKESKDVKAKFATVPVIQKSGNDKDMLLLSLLENTQKPPSQWEVGTAYRRLMEGDDALTVEQIATRMGQSAKYVKDALELEDAPEEIKQLLSEMAVTPSHAIATIKSRGGTATAVLKSQVAAAKKKAQEKAAAREEKKAATGGKSKGGRPPKADKPVTVKREKKAGGKFIKDGVLKLIKNALNAAKKSDDVDISMPAETAAEALAEAVKKE